MSLFEKNLSLLCERAPELGWKIKRSLAPPAACPPEMVEVGLGDVLYLVGLGAQVPHWEGHLVLVDHDMGRWKGWLELKEATPLLENSKVMLASFDPDNPDDPFFQHCFSFFSTLKAEVAVSGMYRARHSDLAQALAMRIQQDSAASCRLVDEYRAHCHNFYRNFYTNLHRLPQASWGAHFFGKFEGVPAIICGAGPSLDKNIEVLATLRDKALIFAGGSALNATSCNGVLPHFGAGVDPHYHQFERLMMNHAFETPMFYRGRWNDGALPLIQGTPLYLNGSGGQPVAAWIERELGIPGPILDEGQNVVNFTVEIARALGCNPILFVGMDLAYSGDCQYAQHVLHEVAVDREKLLTPEHFCDAPLERTDIHGNPIVTHWKWLAEARWIADYQKEHPELTLINCTEGGIGFPGIPNRCLEEIEFSRSWPLQERVRASMGGKIEVDRARIAALLDRLAASLRQCDTLLGELDAEFAAMIERADTLPPTLRSGRAACLEVELELEVAYQAILSIFSYVFQSQMNRKLAELDDDQRVARLHVERERIECLREAAQTNLEILQACR